MKETEDQRIRDKFREVFENFEDHGSHEGWLELRKKYPEAKQRPMFFWISSAAAILVLISGLWLFNPQLNQELKDGDNKTTINTPQTQVKPGVSDPIIVNAPAKPGLINSELKLSADTKPGSINKSEFPQKEKMILSRSSDYSNRPEGLTIPVGDSVSTTEYALIILPKTAEEQVIKPDTMILAIGEVTKTDQYLKPEPEEYKLPGGKGKNSEKSKEKNFSLSVYAGSFFNYAEGSENNVNIGAGLSSDFRISKNLKISTGLNLSKNSLTYNQNEPSNNYGSFQNANASLIGSLVALSNYNAELLSLDIPVNIKYFLNPEKSSAYFLAGLSSGTYLTEKYGVQSSNFNTLVGSALADKQEIKKQINDFDLMRTLNVSFGFNARLSKKQTLTIEPFLKYPLGGLGSENIRFGASGVNVKLNFNTSKKP